MESLLHYTGASEEDWRQSLKQGLSLKLPHDQLEHLQQEVVCSPAMLIGHLVDWSSRLKATKAATAKAILCDLFTKTLTPYAQGWTQHRATQATTNG